MVQFRSDYRCIFVVQKGGVVPEPTPAPEGAIYLAQVASGVVTPGQFVARNMVTGDTVSSIAANENQVVGLAVMVSRGRLDTVLEIDGRGEENSFGLSRGNFTPAVGGTDDIIEINGKNFYRYMTANPINMFLLGHFSLKVTTRRTMMQRFFR